MPSTMAMLFVARQTFPERGPNPAPNRTARKLRLRVPSSLRSSAAG